MPGPGDMLRVTLTDDGAEPEPTNNWTVYRTLDGGSRVSVEFGLPDKIARQMVADYAAEGDDTLEAVAG